MTSLPPVRFRRSSSTLPIAVGQPPKTHLEDRPYAGLVLALRRGEPAQARVKAPGFRDGRLETGAGSLVPLGGVSLEQSYCQ
ncbi:MAG TPA: hypothetical protein PKK57_13210 [Verrucomicrobiota bacterium]|nr:hypothetical protein [Verrucomicrobiota bacterium]